MSMVIEDAFPVAAPPDLVYAYLLDVEKVVPCMPGGELVDRLDDDTFKVRVKVKVGPITARYEGTATIVERDPAGRRATMRAEAREAAGAGSARAAITMAVEAADGGSTVRLSTDYAIAGRVAQFGRSVIDDVSRHLMAEMAGCIRARLEAPAQDAAAPGATPVEGGAAPRTHEHAQRPAAPASGIRLLLSVLRARLRRLVRGAR